MMRWPRILISCFVGVGVDDPVQRLLRRRDGVAIAGEHDDRRADLLHVDLTAALDARLAPRQPIADEQLLDDPADLGLGHEVIAAPPALEFEEFRPPRIDVAIEVVIFAPEVARRIEQLEIRDEMGAVELAMAEVAQSMRTGARPPRSPPL